MPDNKIPAHVQNGMLTCVLNSKDHKEAGQLCAHTHSSSFVHKRNSSAQLVQTESVVQNNWRMLDDKVPAHVQNCTLTCLSNNKDHQKAGHMQLQDSHTSNRTHQYGPADRLALHMSHTSRTHDIATSHHRCLCCCNKRMESRTAVVNRHMVFSSRAGADPSRDAADHRSRTHAAPTTMDRPVGCTRSSQQQLQLRVLVAVVLTSCCCEGKTSRKPSQLSVPLCCCG